MPLTVPESDRVIEAPHPLPRFPAADEAALRNPKFVSEWVEALLRAAVEAQVSDVHLTPDAHSLDIQWRLDGVLAPAAKLPKQIAPNIIARLKVLSELLTYHAELPQEGRLRWESADVEMRFSTFPTIYGERGVIRLFIGSSRYRLIEDLGFPDDLEGAWRDLLRETSGVLLIAGPAGSGKTTTAYAALREIQRTSASAKSLLSLEDPVEAVLPGVTQAQVNRAAGFDYAVGLRSLMRQDPDVVLVGEIRDRETAETVFQAGLTGHLVLSTYHAGHAAEAVSRLSDMGIEPYLLRSGLLGILCQRLVRRLCDCAAWSDSEADHLGLPVSQSRIETGCERCGARGYTGRFVLAELLLPDDKHLAQSILARADADEIRSQAIRSGMSSLGQRGLEAVRSGETSARELRRVLGFRPLEGTP
jgi:type II secretory ATPase GspE/PulE/Tfp pilus assembly ATPase PilB-like protein